MANALESATYSTGLTLFQSILSQGDKSQNVFISPLSILGALSMCAAGASGDTFREIVDSLHLSGISRSDKEVGALLNEFKLISSEIKKEADVKLRFANAIMMLEDVTLKDEFRKGLEDSFDALLKCSTDPNALVTQVNKWCGEKTEGRIPKIIDRLDPSQKLVLLNAVYFKGLFNSPFKKQNTKQKTFYSFDGKIDCEMMSKREKKIRYRNADLFQAVALPYVGRRMELIVILPKEDGEASLSRVVESLMKGGRSLMSGFTEQEGTVEMPKFKFKFEKVLNSDLQQMGIKKSFSPSAEFDKMSDTTSFCVDQVIHSSFVEVNEEGTEAAAVTAVVMRTFAMLPEQPFSFRADRPFVFAIQKIGVGLLFVGCVKRPE